MLDEREDSNTEVDEPIQTTMKPGKGWANKVYTKSSKVRTFKN